MLKNHHHLSHSTKKAAIEDTTSFKLMSSGPVFTECKNCEWATIICLHFLARH